MEIVQHPASRTVLCISPAGDVLVPGTQAFQDRIGYQSPDFDIGDYAVRNMGFIAISRSKPDTLKVRFRPELVAGKAVEAVTRFLSSRDAAFVELEVFTEDWRSETLPNDHEAVRRIVDLCATPTARPFSERFRIEPAALDRASADYGNPMKPIIQKWRVSSGAFDDTTLPFVMRYGMSLAMSIFAAKSRSDSLCFQFVSDTVKLFDTKTKTSLIGRPIEDQPDKDYANWIVPQYRSVMESCQPRLDVINAEVQKQTGGTRKIAYERLLLPWRYGIDGIIITTAIVLLSTERESLANDNLPLKSANN